MECRIFENDIALGTDAPGLSRHLRACPFCAMKQREFDSLHVFFRAASTTEVPTGLVSTVKRSVSEELQRNSSSLHPGQALISDLIRTWLVPYSIAVAASLVITTSLLWLLMAPIPPQTGADASSRKDAQSTEVVFLGSGSGSHALETSHVSAERLVRDRAAVATFSPTVNPEGTFMGLATSLASGKFGGDEIVMVLNVFGDGTADLEQMVRPLDSPAAIAELHRALEGKESGAPFVPASLDGRTDIAKVVFKMQKVEVHAGIRKN